MQTRPSSCTFRDGPKALSMCPAHWSLIQDFQFSSSAQSFSSVIALLSHSFLLSLSLPLSIILYILTPRPCLSSLAHLSPLLALLDCPGQASPRQPHLWPRTFIRFDHVRHSGSSACFTLLSPTLSLSFTLPPCPSPRAPCCFLCRLKDSGSCPPSPSPSPSHWPLEPARWTLRTSLERPDRFHCRRPAEEQTCILQDRRARPVRSVSSFND